MIDAKNLSYTEKKRLRANYGEHVEQLLIPNLLNIQLNSYENFTQINIKNNKIKKDIGLENVLTTIFPIYSNNKNIKIEYISYTIGKSLFNKLECKTKGLTYAGPLKIKIHLNTNVKLKTEVSVTNPITQEIYILDLPLMTENGSFIINGTERVVVSQLHRSPGLFFEKDKTKSTSSEKYSYTAKIIPHKGAWLDIEFDTKNCIFARIDKKRKFPITIILKALGLHIEKILNKFFVNIKITIKNKKYYTNIHNKFLLQQYLQEDIKKINGKIITKNTLINQECIDLLANNNINTIQLSQDFIINKIISRNIYNKNSNTLLIPIQTKITKIILDHIENENIEEINIIDTKENIYGTYILNTLNIDHVNDQLIALMDIYKILRPGELPTKDSAKQLFENLFFTKNKYDLSLVGRIKLNKRLNHNEDIQQRTLSINDIIKTIYKLIDIKHDKDHIDDIDNLTNRRVRSVGEIIGNQFKTGFSKIERSIKDKLSLAEYENLTPQDIINAKPIATMIREFFCSNQLSQFMDQNNPLSEITHKRRISALGPGGLTRERAGFEVRDVHNTHYGKICPIETPEGPNIGLINSLAIYARTNDYGFLETPYIKVTNKILTKNISYLSAMDEDTYVIAQATTKIDKKNKELKDKLISCRYKNEFIFSIPEKVEFMDVSTKQIVSVAAALIPFLEHDDANRALMGSNMQRQAVPILKAEKPLVGTGMERIVVQDSGVAIIAKADGIIDKVDSSRIIVKTYNSEVNIYNLTKFTRSNHNTCINQKPIVKKGEKIKENDILADGPATDLGELALGQNLLVAFMPWNGYNFEDSIILSENIVKDNKLTSVHIEELICIARDLKLGPEEITCDIPNVNSSALINLDESGIIYIGAKANPRDILVGKVTQKGESQLTPEEKLLQAIFGEKASDVKDSSLRVPTGISGTIIDVQIFTREGIKKDKRTLDIEDQKLHKIKINLNDEFRILQHTIFEQIKYLLLQKTQKNIINNIYITKSYLDKISKEELIKIKIQDTHISTLINKQLEKLNTLQNNYELKYKIKKIKIKQSDELAPGILKIVKVYIAIKRQIQPGDKISGRHGNKGVVSIIVPIEDMPYLQDGTPIDIILNPLGVPSRMNVGQVLETHLGWAAKTLGTTLKHLNKNFNDNKNKIKQFLSEIYNIKSNKINFNSFTENELKELINNLSKGVPMATPVFDGINEKDIKNLLTLSNLPNSGKTILYDGRTGTPFENEITVGYKYIMKLNHLIDDKMHARSTGSYSLVSQQPLGGKAQFGGQRFGEMEVWALEAYGAAYTLQEMLTIKSDDISGRTKIYKNMIDNNYQIETGLPEAFHVLSKEILSLGLNIELENK